MNGKPTLADLRARRDERDAQRERDAKLARAIDYRRRYLPRQIVAARLKVEHLEREAERLGLAL